MFKLFTMVRILIDTHCSMDGHAIPAGSTGAVVEIYAQGAAYEIETFNPPGLVSVRNGDLMGADVPLTLRTLIDKPTSHYYAARISFAESGFDHRTVKSVLLKLSEWCAARWSPDDWDRTETTFLLRTDAMAFEFKMRWDGADFDGIFG